MKRSGNSATVWTIPLLLAVLAGCTGGTPGGRDAAPGIRRKDAYTLSSERDLIRGVKPRNADGTVNVVVENPSGTSQRWAVREDGRRIECRLSEGKPELLGYLGYPANYGMMPGTLLPEALGGEGDGLDVLVLGPPLARGAVVAARPIGLLRLAEKSRQDDKVLAVTPGSVFGELRDLDGLDARFPGVTSIIRTWFENQKGPGRVRVAGFAGPKEARDLIDASIQAFELGQRKSP